MSEWATVGLALVCLVWLVVAGWALVSGLGHRRAAAAARLTADRLALLIDRSPAMPMLVRVDGRLEAPERLAQRLGLATPPAYLSDLGTGDAGLTAADLDLLEREVGGTQRTGRRFALTLSPQHSDRRLIVEGQPASRSVLPGGGTLTWWYDATEIQQEGDALRREHAALDGRVRALSALVDQAPFPVWHRDEGGRLRLVNRAYVEAVEGETAAGVVAAGTELLDATVDGPPGQQAARARETGRPITRTLPATVGHDRRTLQVTDVPLGELGVAGFAFDVGDREEAFASVRRFTEAQRTMLDRLSAGVIQFAPDRTLSFANQPFRRTFGLEAEATVGVGFDRLLDAMRDAGRLPPARDFPAFRAERRRWFQAREPEEESWHLPDGTYLRVVPQPLPDGALLVVFEDRTEEARLAGARDSLIQMRAATFDNLFEAVAVVSQDGRIQLWNERFRALFGLEPAAGDEPPRLDEQIEALADQFAGEDDRRAVVSLTRAAVAERVSGSRRVVLATGTILQAAAVPLPNGDALLTLLDITDPDRMARAERDRAAALAENDRIKSAFVETMSYELRTPLTSISGFAELMADGAAGELSDTAIEYARAIGEAVGVLSGLIDNVLDLTAGAAGRLAGESEAVDLDWLLHDLAAGAARQAEAKGLSWAARLDDDLPTITGDAGRLRKAVGHLVDNALRYTPAGGQVLLHADHDAARVRIVVSDNGPGMSEAEAARALDLFTAGEPTRRMGALGLGLGLPLARQVALAHLGTLTLHSEPGEGTAAVLELPR